MNTIRELIILEFMARAAVIRTTGSPQAYATDIGKNVVRARKTLDADELPAIVIWPMSEESQNTHGMARHIMTLRAEGICKFGTDNPSVISERILGDLIKCFTSPLWDRRRLVESPESPVTYLQPYADSIVYKSGGLESALDDGAVSVGAQAGFEVTYWTKIGDPYNQ